MSVVLYRVDERLIHGQVVIGWGAALRPDRYVVVDDELAASEWEQELYRLSVPEGAGVEFLDVPTARRRLDDLRRDERRTVILTRDLATMLGLGREGLLRGESVNLGGIHPAADRARVRPYLYLDEADRSRIRHLEDEGVRVSARDLPDSVRVGVDDLLSGE